MLLRREVERWGWGQPAPTVTSVLTPTLVALLLTAGPSPVLLAPYIGPEVAFRFADPRIDESSGLASSSTADGVLFTHNDSGDEARFFAVGPDGRTLVTYTLPGVQARDWEDMARGPDDKGRSSLWFGDIGDNNAMRDNGLLVHRVREPVPGDDPRVTTEPPTSFRLRYADGPKDAETLLVHPRTGRLYVITKPFAGPAKVYAAPTQLDPAGPNALEQVAQVDLKPTGTSGGPNIGALAQVLVTAADIAPDGSRVALRTYTDLYEWAVPGDDVAAAFDGAPTVTPLPVTRQGEGLAYSRDGRAVLLSSEGQDAPVHRLTAPEPRNEGDASDDLGVPTPAATDTERPPWAVVLAGAVAVGIVAMALVRRRTFSRR